MHHALTISLFLFSLEYTSAGLDLEIREGGGPSPKKMFSALRVSVWSKNKGGGGSSGPLPWICHCT